MKKTVLFRILTITLCLIMTAFAFAGCGKSAADDERPAFARAYVDEEGNIYASSLDGNKKKISSGDGGVVLSDGKYALLNDKSGSTVAYCNVKSGKITEVNDGEPCALLNASSTNIMYATRDSGTMQVYALFLESGKNVCVYDSDTDEYGFSYACANVLNATAFYWQEKEAIYTVSDGDKEPQKQLFVSADMEPEIVAVSADGNRILWQDCEGNTNLLVDGKNAVVFDDEYSQKRVRSFFDRSGKYTLITHYDDDTIMLYDGTKCKEISQHRLMNGIPYTENGAFTENTSSKINGLYLAFTDDEYSSSRDLYYVDTDGERTRVVSDVLDFDIFNGTIAYKVEDGLYCARLSKGELKDKERVSKSADILEISKDGKFVLYRKSDNVYMYSVEKKDSEKICPQTCDYYWAADKSGTVFFIDSSDNTLYRYEYGKDENVKIFDDVAYITSGFESGNVKSGSFDILRDNGDGTLDLYYYNGKTAKKVLSGVTNGAIY